MNQDLIDMLDAERRQEMGEETQSDKAWYRFAARVETLIGCDLDGDGATDGYSLDQAYDAFCARQSPDFHVREINARRTKLGLEAL